jgi:hypothetical protein
MDEKKPTVEELLKKNWSLAGDAVALPVDHHRRAILPASRLCPENPLKCAYDCRRQDYETIGS